MRVIELFGGIGAFTHAVKRLGLPIEVVDYVEIDKYANASYNAMNGTNFPCKDIRHYNGGGRQNVDLVIHGSPCQDYSLSGKQAGGDEGSGTRSSLMYESIRIIGEVMPKVVIWENVKNLLSPKHKHNYDEYLKRLEKLGYTNYYKVLNAKNYGIPQNRERIFTISILGEHKPFEFPAEIELTTKLVDLLEPDVPEDFYISQEKIDKLLSKEIYQKHPAVLKDGTVSAICSRDYKDPKCIVVGADTLAIKEATKKGYTLAGGYDSVNLEQLVGDSKFSITGVQCGLRVRKLTPKECWRLMGFTDEAYEKAAEVNSKTQLYKQAGNSIVVNVLMEIIKQLMKSVEF